MYSKEILTLNPEDQFLSQHLWHCKRSRTPLPHNLSLIQIIINLWCSSHLTPPWHQPAFFGRVTLWCGFITFFPEGGFFLPYCDAVSEFVILGRENGRKHFGIEPAELFSLTPDLRSTGFHRTQTQGLLPGPQAGALDNHRPPDRRIQFRKSHALISPWIISKDPLDEAWLVCLLMDPLTALQPVL